MPLELYPGEFAARHDELQVQHHTTKAMTGLRVLFFLLAIVGCILTVFGVFALKGIVLFHEKNAKLGKILLSIGATCIVLPTAWSFLDAIWFNIIWVHTMTAIFG